MSYEFTRKIANMITEDPDITREDAKPEMTAPKARKNSWKNEKQLEAEELELEGDDLMYFVKFTVGMNSSPGEKMVRYYSDGSGYPGSPDEIEWEILSIDGAEAVDETGDDVEVELSEELKERIKQGLYKGLDDEKISEQFGNTRDDDDGDARYDAMRDREGEDRY